MDKRYILSEEEISLARKAVTYALEKGADKVRITLNKSLMDLVGTLNGEIDKVSHCLDRSMSINLFVDGRFGTFSLNRFEERIVEDFIAKAVDTTRMLAPDSCRDLPEQRRVEKGAATGMELDLYDGQYDRMDSPRRVALALGASIFKDNPGAILSEEAEYSDSVFDNLIIDSEGTFCRHTETSFEYGVEITISDGGDRYSSYWWDSSPRLEDLRIGECCSIALERARAQIGPKPQKSGRYCMVIDSECASKVVTPLLNALNAYSLQQNNSFLLDSLGKKIFSDGFTIMEACRSKGETGSRLFDSEGVATRTVPIIEGGVVKQYFVNTYMAAKMGLEGTVEGAIRPKVMPWPVAGLDREAIMKRCGEGILVTGFNGGNSNSSTGDYSFGIEGFAFKDGRITHPVREMLVTGNFITLWSNLLAAGDDARLCMSKLIPTLAFSNVDFSG